MDVVINIPCGHDGDDSVNDILIILRRFCLRLMVVDEELLPENCEEASVP